MKFDEIKNVNLYLDGARNFDLSGTSNNFVLKMNGAGNLNAKELVSTKAD